MYLNYVLNIKRKELKIFHWFYNSKYFFFIIKLIVSK